MKINPSSHGGRDLSNIPWLVGALVVITSIAGIVFWASTFIIARGAWLSDWVRLCGSIVTAVVLTVLGIVGLLMYVLYVLCGLTNDPDY